MKIKLSMALKTGALALLLMLASFAPPAMAFMEPNIDYIKVTQESDLIFVGTLNDIRRGRAQLEVEEVLKGVGFAPQVQVAPVTDVRGVMGKRTFQDGELVLLFLTRDAINPALYNIMVNGWSAVQLAPENREERIEAIEYLLTLPARTEKDAIARAMLKVADSDNAFLRMIAPQTVRDLPRDRDNPLRYEPELLALLQSPRRDARQTALAGLADLASPRALPLLIQIARGDDDGLANDAGFALGRYDTPESVAALIELSHHRNPSLRKRAIVDLGNMHSKRPEVKAALLVALDDADPTVRALAPTRFIGLLRLGLAADVVPRLIEMLDDPVAEVQIDAVQSLAESADVAAIAPLFAVLRRPDLNARMEAFAVGALSNIYSHLKPPARPPLADNNTQLVLAISERSQFSVAIRGISVLSLATTPQTLAALRQIAGNHPDWLVRESAQKSIDAAG